MTLGSVILFHDDTGGVRPGVIAGVHPEGYSVIVLGDPNEVYGPLPTGFYHTYNAQPVSTEPGPGGTYYVESVA